MFVILMYVRLFFCIERFNKQKSDAFEIFVEER